MFRSGCGFSSVWTQSGYRKRIQWAMPSALLTTSLQKTYVVGRRDTFSVVMHRYDIVGRYLIFPLPQKKQIPNISIFSCLLSILEQLKIVHTHTHPHRSTAPHLSARGVTTVPGSNPGCITFCCDLESHRAAHNWLSIVRGRLSL